MSSDISDSAWFTEEQAILVLTLISVVLAALVVLPYLQYLLFGIILAYILWPLQRRLSEHLRRDFSALVLTIATILFVPVPFVYLVGRLSQEAFAVLRAIERADIDAAEIEVRLLEFGIELDIEEFYQENQELVADGLEFVALYIANTAQSLPQIFIGLTITVFVQFVLLRDGHRLVAWTRSILPIRDEIQDELNERLNRLMRASVVGNVAASLVQAVALGIGFWLLGFDNVIFLTVLTFILALLPLVGAFIVWVPVVGYLVAIGSFGTAIILFVYGSIVSISDFYTRPIVIGHSAELNSAIIVIGVFGGLVVFGPVGLLIGPVVLGGSKVTIEALVHARNQDLDIS